MRTRSTLIIALAFFNAETRAQAVIPAAVDSTPVKVYLTFDDGPTAYSHYLIDLARKDSVPVNVFIIGYRVFAFPGGLNVLDPYWESGFVEVYNHSFSHAHKKYQQFYSRPGTVTADILLNQDTLQLKQKIARLPGRNSWRIGNRGRYDLPDAIPACDSLALQGFSIIGWDTEWQYDSTCRFFYTAKQMLDLVKNVANTSFTPGHVVILCHDQLLVNEYSRQQLALFLQDMKKEKRLKLEFISKYPR